MPAAVPEFELTGWLQTAMANVRARSFYSFLFFIVWNVCRAMGVY